MLVDMSFGIFFTVSFLVVSSAYAKQDILLYNKDVRGHRYEYTNVTFEHAESPVWLGDTQTLLWVDVLAQEVHAFNFVTNDHRVRYIEYGEVNIVLPIQDSARFLLAVRQSLYILDWDVPGPNGLKLLTTLDAGFPSNIVNEGWCDALGRLWVGTKGPQSGLNVLSDYGSLYSIQAPIFTPQYQLKPVTISNGLIWSLNNTVLFYIDSATRKLEAFDFDLKTAHISSRRTILELADHPQIPQSAILDGMTIDKEGFLWVTLYGGGAILRVDPEERRIVAAYKLPTTQITSVMWAGRGLDHLVVTSSKRNLNRTELARQPLAGVIFILHGLGTSGVPGFKFNFPNADSY